MKREEKQKKKSQEKDVKNKKQCDTSADFLSFSEVDISKFSANRISKDAEGVDSRDDLENRIASKYDRDQYPWLSDFTLKIKEAYIFLHNEILDFVKFIEASEEDIKLRKSVVMRVKQVVRECYPEADVMVFGSCATGLNLPNSDIDLLVYQPDVKETSMITKLTSALIKAGICKSIEPLKNAKVPIIKL